MAPLAQFALLGAVALGHFSIAVWLFNRLHATTLSWRVIKWLEKLLMLTAATILAALVVQAISVRGSLFAAQGVALGYGIVCLLAAAAVVPLWLLPKLLARLPSALMGNDTTCLDVSQRLGFAPVHGTRARFWSQFPGNELLKIAVHRKTLRLPSLPKELDGLSIAHLSDLHMTGRLTREFYDVIVDETNALDADLIAITGDILEEHDCLPWIAATLGRLQARYGKFFVLGNHELRLGDVAPLRKELADAGLADLGSRCEQVKVRDVWITIAGTELPWFGLAPQVLGTHSPFRILLAHTPDQYGFAKQHDFDLMLAGHNHGGQIRLPYLGALIAPSRYGCRYAGGLYHEPPTLLHVSRGLAGTHLIRLNCPPELALLTLKSQAAG